MFILRFFKKLIFIFIMFFLGFIVGSSSVRADSYTTYDGNIISTALSYFRDVDLPFFSNYVVWRDGDYSYKMFVSDTLSTSGSGFVADSGTIYNWYTSGTYNNTQHYIHSEINNFSLSNNNHYIVYSSLGTYARLERGLNYDKLQIFTLFTVCLFVLIGIIYKFINIKPFGSRKS